MKDVQCNRSSMSSAWGKRMSSAWGKRMSSAWGKRADPDNDDFYNHLLRELLQQGRWNKYENLRYSLENEGKQVLSFFIEKINLLIDAFF